jgi:Tol biopolymer transport system component
MVAFIDHPVSSDMGGQIEVVDRSGRARVLARGFNLAWGLAWSPDGREVWFTAAPTGGNQALYAVTLDGRQRLVSRVMGSMRLDDIAPSGEILLTRWNESEHVMAMAPGQAGERDLTWLDMSLSRALSDDGRMVLLLESGEGGGEGNSVFLRKTDGSPAVRLGEGAPWALSPDGRLAAAFVTRSDGMSLVLYPTGPGEARTIALPGLEPQAADFLPDGRRILFTAGQSGRSPRLYLVEASGGSPRTISPEGYRAFEGTVSPDGTRVVVAAADGQILLFPIEGGEPTPIPGAAPSDIPRSWDADGRHLYVTGKTNTIPRRVDRLDVVTGRRELWKELGRETGAVGIHIAPDGRSYVYSYVRGQADLFLVEGIS